MALEIATIVLVIILMIMLLVFNIWGDRINAFLLKFFGYKKNRNHEAKKVLEFVNNLASVLAKMSADKVGALIVIENRDNLINYINIGNRVDAPFFPEFVTSIFYNKKSPLHDGAIIVKDLRIASLSSYLPMTKKVVKVEYGARHRAAFGVCEKFDCFAFVVSETNGNITSVHLNEAKQLYNSPEKLVSQIFRILSASKLSSNKNLTKGLKSIGFSEPEEVKK